MMHLILAFFILATGPAYAAKKTSPGVVSAPPATAMPSAVAARPKMTGEFVIDADLKTVSGESVALSGALDNKFSVVVFAKPENIWLESAAGYFKSLVPYLKKLDFQVVFVTPEVNDAIKKVATVVESDGYFLVDEHRQAFVGMGLMDRAEKDAPAINAIYLVAPDRQIMFQYASITDKIPFSGEVLVLAARVYRDAFREKK